MSERRLLRNQGKPAPVTTWLAMRRLPPAPVPYAKALPAPVATWLAMRKLPLSQCGAVRVQRTVVKASDVLHLAITITSSGLGARRKNMSNMVLGPAPVQRPQRALAAGAGD